MRKTPNCERLPINIVGSSTFGLNPKISLEKTYNMYVSDDWLINMPGYRRVLDIFETGVGRGAFVSVRGNFAILVVNAAVYKLSTSLGLQLIGNLQTASGPVFIDENLNAQICIVDGTNAYIYNWDLPAQIVIQTTVSSVFTPNYVTFHHSFFLFGNADRTANGALWYTYQYDSMNPQMLQQVVDSTLAIQTKPDFANAVVRIPGQSSAVLVLGKSVSEVWNHVAGASTNYVRNPNFNVDYGCISVDTIAFNDKFVAWLGSNTTNSPVIMVFEQQSVKEISTDGIDNVLRTIKHPERSTANMYKQNGHFFYQLTFFDPEDNLTLVYDFDHNKFYHGSDQHLNYHPAKTIFYFNGKVYFLSLNNATLYEMSPDIWVINEQTPSEEFPEDPRLVWAPQRLRICQPIRMADSAPFRINQLVFTLRMGNENILTNDCQIWLISEDGIRLFSEDNKQLIPENGSPDDCFDQYYRGRVDLSISRDGGESFSNFVSREMKPLGHRQNIIRWESCGSGNDITPQFRFWSLGSITANNGFVDVVQ